MKKRYSERKLFELAEKHLAPNYEPFPVIVKRAKGCWVWDVKGRKYLEMLSGYSVVNCGHRHPRVIRAAKEQLNMVTNCPRKFLSEELILLAKELTEFCGMEMVLFMNSGTEVFDTAVKLARKWAYTRKKKRALRNQAEIIVCKDNFHGRTIAAISASTVPQYKGLFGPLMPGIKYVPFDDTQALCKAITPNTAAFIVEPILGEGGIMIPNYNYLRECKKICRKADILFILDEVQTGFARTGRMFACDHEDIKPDILLLAKALSGGISPISAVVSSRKILSVFKPGDHGSTFGGNPFACHIAREVLRVLKEEHLAERAAELGRYFMEKLKDIDSPHVKEVRGKGLLIGVEVRETGPTAHEFCERLIKSGILCSDTKKYVIRFAPPLTITRKELDWALERIKRVLS
ncbi:MAG: ornithine--oxo-acid transaminase [Candidatus Taylorbacteria bacterium]|nr:ornithine--oxo-acid transaminase [Candidatus Taylorbacteria bacterium]